MSFERGINQKRENRLKLGSISEVWREKDRWDNFVQYLAPMSEGDDSDGNPMSLSRYARFLELYVKLDQLGNHHLHNTIWNKILVSSFVLILLKQNN